MGNMLTISVAMCTYNGEKFLNEQLNSFLWQTRLPDEIVICDDGSHDGTIDILENFSAWAPFPVKIYRNRLNLGYSKNFEKAGSLCSGDIIAFSDQDDVWDQKKLEEFERIMIDNSEVGFIFCDAEAVDEELNPLGYSFWDNSGLAKCFTIFSKGEFTNFFFMQYHCILGATSAIRRSVYKSLVPIPPLWAYDEWVPFGSSVITKIAKVPYRFNKYRQHGNQCFGLGNIIESKKMILLKFNYKLNRMLILKQEAKLLDGLLYLNRNNIIDYGIIENFYEFLCHFDNRARLPYNIIRRIRFVLNEIISGRYHKFSNGWRSAIRDLILF